MSHLGDPSLYAVAVTPDDDVILPKFRYLYVGSTGNVTIKNVNDTEVTFAAVPAGQYIYASGVAVMETGTGASDIVAIY